MCGDAGGLNRHSIPYVASSNVRFLFSVEYWTNIFFRSASAPIKLVPQSEWIIAGKPLREENRLKAAMNVSVEHPVTASRWTADVVKHTNMQIHPLSVFAPGPFQVLMAIGPA
ncbi:hypothetical protein PV325_010048 [Microctonus aethiopoides]|nr:hypothetical protein PV325_010048 [Microctonus aethiopoides]